MRQRSSRLITVAVLTALSLSVASTACAQEGIQRAYTLAEARYQQAARESQDAKRAFDEAVARNRDAAANYQAAVNEQKTAARLLADADVSGPRAAEEVRRAEATVGFERTKVAPQQARLDAAAAEHRRLVEAATGAMPEAVTARQRVEEAQERYDDAVEDTFAALPDADEYMDLLVASWDAEAEAIALRDTVNVDASKLADATIAWMATLNALERYESQALAGDADVRAAADALAQAQAEREAVISRLAQRVADDPAIQRAAEAFRQEQVTFNGVSSGLQRAQADLDRKRGELARIDQVAADARQRLAQVEKDLPLIQADVAKTEEEARRAEANLGAAQRVEQVAVTDRDLIAADLHRGTYVPEPVYVEPPPVIIVDGGTTVYYPPDRDKHHHHDRDKDRHDGDRERDRDHGTRRDEGDGPARRRDASDGGARRDEPQRPNREEPEGPKRGAGAQPGPTPSKPSGKDAQDIATARRQQEEAKAAERQRREDAAAAAAASAAAEKKKSDDSAAQAAAAARQREEAGRAESRRAEAESRKQSESSARQQQQQERQRDSSSSSGGSSSSSGDRGDRYRRR